MMGDRNYRELIQNAIDSIGRELDIAIDVKDAKTIHAHEVVGCLRRSYYDRTDPIKAGRGGFSDLTSGLLRKMHYGSEPGDFDLEGVKLRGQADVIVDDAVLIFRSADTVPDEPLAGDVLYLNALLWIYNKDDGIVNYITGNRKETAFTLTKDKRMFEEVIRRVRVFADLLNEKKTPILEPSDQCSSCQYFERCYIKRKISKQITLAQLIGLDKE